MECSRLVKPVIFVGVPRSGTTILFEAFARHPETGWLSNYSEMYPKVIWLNSLCRLLDNKIIHISGRKRQHGSVIRGNRYLPTPDEAYHFWDRYSSYPMSKDYLIDKAPDGNEQERMRTALNKIMVWQGKHRFSAKFTGPARIRYLQGIFRDAIFVHVLRDGRAVVNSLLKVPFWRNGGGLDKPWWNGGLSQELLNIWKSSNANPAVLAAIQWKAIIEIARKEANGLHYSQYWEVHYEAFIKDPHRILREIYKSCGLSDSQRGHDYINAGPELREMNKKYEEDMSPKDIRLMTEVMQPLLGELGYGK